MSTQRVAEPIPGNKLYQRRAMTAFPILVRQAESHGLITYKDLGNELGVRPRNLNFILGSIGRALQKLEPKWGEPIPPIPSIVVNSATGLPGRGGRWFAAGDEHERMNERELGSKLNDAQRAVFLYKNWAKVLNHFGLQKISVSDQQLEAAARSGRGRGEGADHKALKQEIAKNPGLVHLPYPKGEIEHPLPSGDWVDVWFETDDEIAAIEVKTVHSSEADLLRGIFQCVKYQAVINATLKVTNAQKHVLVLLAVEGKLPGKLVSISKILRVNVVELLR